MFSRDPRLPSHAPACAQHAPSTDGHAPSMAEELKSLKVTRFQEIPDRPSMRRDCPRHAPCMAEELKSTTTTCFQEIPASAFPKFSGSAAPNPWTPEPKHEPAQEELPGKRHASGGLSIWGPSGGTLGAFWEISGALWEAPGASLFGAS